MSPSDRFIAAVFEGQSDGQARSIYREDAAVDPQTGARSTVRLVRGVHAVSGKHWTLAQVPEHVRFTESVDKLSKAERARLITLVEPRVAKEGRAVLDADLLGQKVAEEVEAYFRSVHASTGPTDLPISYGPALFSLTARTFDSAILGANCIAVGDSVGTSHFNVSGGAATGITTHTLALDRFLSARARGADAKASMAQLDHELRQATLMWQLFGITQFEGDARALRDTWLPRTLLEKYLSPDLVEKFFPKTGGAPAEDQNPLWHAWLSGDSKVDPPADAVLPLVDAAIEAQQRAGTSVPTCADLWTAFKAEPASPAAP
jgi:hypothetical protein